MLSKTTKRRDRSWRDALRRLLRPAGYFALAVSSTLTPGCAALHPIRGVPVKTLAIDEMGESRSAKSTIDLSLLTQSKPDQYRVGAEDVLSIYVPGVLGTLIDRDDEVGETPPITVPVNSDAPPTVGFPLTVRGDGTLSLPQVDPINVEGMTLREVEKAIIKAYTVDAKILSSKRPRVIVTLQRPRTYEVLVVRQEKRDEVTGAGAGNGQVNVGSTRKGTARVVSLPAYQNDVLHALAAEEVDGLPGLDAENTIYVIRRRGTPKTLPAGMMGSVSALPCGCPPDACGCQPTPVAAPGGSPVHPQPMHPQPMHPQPVLSMPSGFGESLTLPPQTIAPRTVAPQPAAPSAEPTQRLPEPRVEPEPKTDSDEAAPRSASYPSLPSFSATQPQSAGREVTLLPAPAARSSLVVPPAASVAPPVVSVPTATIPLVPLPGRTKPAAEQTIRPTSYETPASQPVQIRPLVRGQSESLGFDGSFGRRLTGRPKPGVARYSTAAAKPTATIQQVGHSSAPLMPTSQPVVLGETVLPIDGQPWAGLIGSDEMTVDNPSVIKIPVRLSPGERPTFTEQDVILQDGDIVFIESRSTEVFYTGGLLGGGQYELPRDYDLRLLEAISIAQSPQNVVAGRSPGGSTALNGDVQYSGSRVIVMRTLPGGGRIPIEVSIYKALKHPEEHNLRIQPGDFIIVQYTKLEAWTAFIQQNLLEGALIGTAFGAFTQSD